MELGPIGLVGFELAARRIGAGVRLEPMSPVDAADGEARARAAAAVERICGLSPESLATILERLRWSGSRVPWNRIHPSWLRSLRREWPRAWRPWLSGELSSGTRAAVQKAALGVPWVAEDPVPSWWPAWIAGEVRRSLGLVARLPVDRDATSASALEDLVRGRRLSLRTLLTTLGIVGLVSHVRSLARPEAQKFLRELPAELHDAAAKMIARKLWVEDPFWSRIVAEIGEDPGKPLDRMLRFGAADVVRAAVQSGASRDLRELALRLPETHGRWMLEQAAAAPEWTAMPVLPGIAEWRERLREIAADVDPTEMVARVHP